MDRLALTLVSTRHYLNGVPASRRLHTNLIPGASVSLHLLIIDPQNDFCDAVHGNLAVPGAAADMDRLARMIDGMRDRLSGIHISLDAHHKVDISHPIWWRDARGLPPAPFTVIRAADVRAGRWSTTQPAAAQRSLAYLDALDKAGRYPHVVWPEHCLIGDAGHNVWPALSDAVHRWEDRTATADFVTKGTNPWTEHFSAIQAEVPDPADPSTQVNSALVSALQDAELVLIAGEALSHCLANTVRDLVACSTDPNLARKLVLLTDATSPVPGFEAQGEAFLGELTALGMRTATTTDAPTG